MPIRIRVVGKSRTVLNGVEAMAVSGYLGVKMIIQRSSMKAVCNQLQQHPPDTSLSWSGPVY